MLGRTWNSERPRIFSPIVLTKTLGVCRDIDIRARTTRRMELWERGLHTGLIGKLIF